MNQEEKQESLYSRAFSANKEILITLRNHAGKQDLMTGKLQTHTPILHFHVRPAN